jgi:hypothetical protein
MDRARNSALNRYQIPGKPYKYGTVPSASLLIVFFREANGACDRRDTAHDLQAGAIHHHPQGEELGNYVICCTFTDRSLCKVPLPTC